MKIIIPTLRKEYEGKILVDELKKQLDETAIGDNIAIIHDEKRTWEQVVSDEMTTEEDVMVMDDDVIILDADWKNKLEQYKEKYDVIGFKLLYPSGAIQHFGGFMRADNVFYHPFQTASDYKLDFDMPCPYVTFSVIFIKKEVLKNIPLIADYMKSTGGSYLEDVDFCFRAREAGFRVGVVPIPFIHLESFTKKQDKLTAMKYQKNLDIFQAKWMQKIMGGEI